MHVSQYRDIKLPTSSFNIFSMFFPIIIIVILIIIIIIIFKQSIIISHFGCKKTLPTMKYFSDQSSWEYLYMSSTGKGTSS